MFGMCGRFLRSKRYCLFNGMFLLKTRCIGFNEERRHALNCCSCGRCAFSGEQCPLFGVLYALQQQNGRGKPGSLGL